MDSSGGEESIGISPAKQLGDPKIQDSSGVRRKPVGPPRIQETLCIIDDHEDERLARKRRLIERSQGSEPATSPENETNGNNAERPRSEQEEARKQAEPDLEAPDGRDENGRVDRFSLNCSGEIKTIDPRVTLHSLAEQLDQPTNRTFECGRALKRDARRASSKSLHFQECLPVEGDTGSLDDDGRARQGEIKTGMFDSKKHMPKLETEEEKVPTKLEVKPKTVMRYFTPLIEELRILPEVRRIQLNPIVEELQVVPEVKTKMITAKVEELAVKPKTVVKTVTPLIEELRSLPEEKRIQLNPIVEELHVIPEVMTKTITAKVEGLEVKPETVLKTVTPVVEELKIQPETRLLTMNPIVESLQNILHPSR